jgi:hypothetical protein
MRKNVTFAELKIVRNMLKKNEIINQVLTRKKVNVFQDKTRSAYLKERANKV